MGDTWICAKNHGFHGEDRSRQLPWLRTLNEEKNKRKTAEPLETISPPQVILKMK